jgi:hypothetical protein
MKIIPLKAAQSSLACPPLWPKQCVDSIGSTTPQNSFLTNFFMLRLTRELQIIGRQIYN